MKMYYPYIKLLGISLALYIVIIIVKVLSKKISSLFKSEKISFKVYTTTRFLINVIFVVSLIVIWQDYIKNFITFISVTAAALAIGLRDVVLNLFCGLYIKTNKPFKLEDRIKTRDVTGDVVAINLLSFELLEVSDNDEHGLSTGVIVRMPSSTILKESIKNLSKGFKYIWDEMEIVLGKDADLKKSKACLYKIINNIEVVKKVPKKMKSQLADFSTSYRIYYNKYDPIVYTKVQEGRIVLILRFLVHPKKARYVESIVWNEILKEEKNNNIILYKSDE